jgi:hypothetical protein
MGEALELAFLAWGRKILVETLDDRFGKELASVLEEVVLGFLFTEAGRHEDRAYHVGKDGRQVAHDARFLAFRLYLEGIR